MSIEPDREDFYRYATFAVLGLIVIVCLCSGLIYVNPRANPIVAWRPLNPTENLSAFAFPATWTPVPTGTSTPTQTDIPTSTATLTPTDTPIPPDTLTPTPEPTETPVPTEIPTETPIPPRPTVPPTPEPTSTPEPTKNPYSWDYIGMKCQHSGGTDIMVLAYLDPNDRSTNQDGIHTRVALSPDGKTIGDVTTAGGNATYILSVNGRPPHTGTFYAWIIDEQGNRISPVSPPIVINGKPVKFADSCWQAFVGFALSE